MTETTAPEQTESTTAPAPEAPALAPAPVIDAPEGTRACTTCGVAVDLAEDHGPVTVEPGGHSMAATAEGARFPIGKYRPPVLLARCADCAERIAQARRIIARHPAVGARYGPDVAADRLAGVLDAVAALGVRFPRHLGEDPRTVRLLLDRMSESGGAVQWRSAYGAQEVTAAQAAHRPFAYVPEPILAAARAQLGVVLRYSVARDQPDRAVTAPHRRGCLMCGVGAVTVPATRLVLAGGVRHAREELWRPHAVAVQSLGGRAGRDRAEGHLCPTCEESADAAGSIGLAAMGRSLAVRLRAVGQPDAARDVERLAHTGELSGLLGWATEPSASPNSAPWEHVELPSWLEGR